jgi:hypothetical protein
MITVIDRKQLLVELRGTICRCGSDKVSKQTFCRACYFRLPRYLRGNLYNLFGKGYEEAYREAIRILDKPNSE